MDLTAITIILIIFIISVTIIITVYKTMDISIRLDNIEADFDFVVTIRILHGLISFRGYKYKYSKEIKKVKPESKSKPDYLKFIKNNYNDIFDILSYIRRKVVLKNSTINIRLGVDDAYYTAILATIMSLVINTCIPLTVVHIKEMPQVSIIPDFNKKVFKFNFYCIVRLRLTHIIFIARKPIVFGKLIKQRKVS